MGRKIPGRKHRTVKDPNVQKAKRQAELKNKINNPPSKNDEQEMPKSVLRIMELKEKAKQFLLSKKLKRKKGSKQEVPVTARFDLNRALGKEQKMPGMEKDDKNLPQLKQGERESTRKYCSRIYRACDDIIREVKFEEQYGVEIKRNEDGKVAEVKKAKTPKRSKKLKLADKRKLREEKKIAAVEPEKEFTKMDRIEFGDIVHEPPTNLKFPGKLQPKDVTTRKPGKTDLLLKEILKEDETKVGASSKKTKLSQIEKEKIEKRRNLVVEAFRQSKKLKKLS